MIPRFLVFLRCSALNRGVARRNKWILQLFYLLIFYLFLYLLPFPWIFLVSLVLFCFEFFRSSHVISTVFDPLFTWPRNEQGLVPVLLVYKEIGCPSSAPEKVKKLLNWLARRDKCLSHWLLALPEPRITWLWLSLLTILRLLVDCSLHDRLHMHRVPGT